MQKRLVHNRNTRSAAASAAASVAASIATGYAFVFGCAAVLRALCLLTTAAHSLASAARWNVAN